VKKFDGCFNVFFKHNINKQAMSNLLRDLVPSEMQTKQWRKEQAWYKGGKMNECEKFQKLQLEDTTGVKCNLSRMRLNFRTFQMLSESNPFKHDHGMDFTEDFDAEFVLSDYKVYANIKMICDAGGAQTRSLREVYHFVHTQLEFLKRNANCKIIFLNILDGDESKKKKRFFNYILNEPEYEDVASNVYCGDMFGLPKWMKERLGFTRQQIPNNIVD